MVDALVRESARTEEGYVVPTVTEATVEHFPGQRVSAWSIS